jgi:hypothetical protein
VAGLARGVTLVRSHRAMGQSRDQRGRRRNRPLRRSRNPAPRPVVAIRRVPAAGLCLDWRAMQVLRIVSKYYAVYRGKQQTAYYLAQWRFRNWKTSSAQTVAPK